LLVSRSRDDGDAQGNPLVAGFQEDLASDDDLKTSDRPITNAEPSSDEDTSKTDLTLSSRYKDSLTAKSSTASVGKSGLEGSSRQFMGEPQKHLAGRDVLADSSDDERVRHGTAVVQDADFSDTELGHQLHKSSGVSTGQVCKDY